MLIDRRPAGRIRPPGSKSISHRALICAALSGCGTVTGAVDNEDTRATLRCLEVFGAEYERENDKITFTSGLTPPKEGAVLDCGESGSTIRFIIPLAAAFGRDVYFTGGGRLMSRPMDIYDGAFTPYAHLQKDGDMFKISGKLKNNVFKLPGDISSQFVTGLLLALPLLDGDSIIEITSKLQSKAYVDLTLDCLTAFGINIVNEDYQKFTVPGNQKYIGRDYEVESDYSSASFILAAAALGCDITCTGLNPSSRQGDRQFLDILARCSADIQWQPEAEKAEAAEASTTASVRIGGGLSKSISVDVSEIPDLVPPLAVIMCFCPGGGEITNAARLRIKECDRLTAVTQELNKLGAKIEEGPDYLKIGEIESYMGGHCHAHNDHRIAMMAALASLKATGPVYIDEPDCVKKSYPEFWSDFLKI